MPRWVEVVLNVPVFQSFTYRAEPEKPGKDPIDGLVGRRVEVRFGSRTMIAFAVGESDELPAGFPLAEDAIKPILRVVDAEPLFDEREIALSRWIASFYLCAPGEALAAMLPSGKREADGPGIAFDDADFSRQELELSEEQRAAVDGILDPAAQTPAYLYGLTGTGKTEVFLRAAEGVLARGKGLSTSSPRSR
jgi:primosomal protein N' (replication factor Y)